MATDRSVLNRGEAHIVKRILPTMALLPLMATTALAGDLTVTVVTGSPGGQIRAAIFDSQKAFEAGARLAGEIAVPANGSAVLTFRDIGPGRYGIAVFHDKNGNEELDRNLFGVPSEPFGFSNNPRIGFKAPGFDTFAFDHDGKAQTITITLNGS